MLLSLVGRPNGFTLCEGLNGTVEMGIAALPAGALMATQVSTASGQAHGSVDRCG